MKLLLLTPQLPYPPHQGTTIRNYNLVRRLAERHKVHLLSFAHASGELERAGPLRAACRSATTVIAPTRSPADRLRGLALSGLPDMALRLPSPEFHARLRDFVAAEDPDVVQVEGIEMAQYGLALADARGARGRPTIVFDDHNAEYVLQRRAWETDARRPRRWAAAAYSFVQWRRLTAYERLACRRADRVVVCSDADRAAVEAILPGLRPAVIPNGVDSDFFRPDPSSCPSTDVVFTGKMDFRPNIDAVTWFAAEVWPSVRAQAPDARFLIVGQRPHPRVSALASAPGVVVTGYVDDVRPYLAAAAAYVVPLRIGGGTRLKILEAMAMGRPLVSTTVGCEGFPLCGGEHLLIADRPGDFAAAVVELLRNPARGAALGAAGRAFVESRYDWKSIVPLFDRVYAE